VTDRVPFHNTVLFRLSDHGGDDMRYRCPVSRPSHEFAPLPRLTQPLVRDGGELRPASWDEALRRAADGFRRTRREAGPSAVGFFSCSKSTNEMNYIAQKFARAVIGTNNIDSCNRT